MFQPHAKLHHIKKENIGLIEVMGLAVLPSRLKKELFELADALVARTPVSQYPEELQKNNRVRFCGRPHCGSTQNLTLLL